MSTSTDEGLLVERLSRFQRAKLTIHSNDREHWREWGQDDFYLMRLLGETVELMSAISEGQTPAQVWREAADVANFAAMLADRYLDRYAAEHTYGNERRALDVMP